MITEQSNTSGSKPCPYCGMYGHSGVCPLVEEIEYYQDGNVKRIKYRGNGLISNQSNYIGPIIGYPGTKVIGYPGTVTIDYAT